MGITRALTIRYPPYQVYSILRHWKNSVFLGNIFVSDKFKDSTQQAKFLMEKLREVGITELNINIIQNNIALEGEDFMIKFGLIENKDKILYPGVIESNTFEKLIELYEKISSLKESLFNKPIIDGEMYWGDLSGQVSSIPMVKRLVYGTDDVRDFYLYLNLETLREFITSSSSVLILQGLPGTGKTRLIEAILYEFWNIKGKAPFISYSANTAAHKNPIIWRNSLERDFLILDDAEELLHGREIDQNFSINTLDILRLSDSLFNLPLKIIFTTNVPHMEIDPPFARPGRTFGIYKTRDLKKEEIGPAIETVKKIYPDASLKKDIEKTLKPTMSLAEIFALFDGAQSFGKTYISFNSNEPREAEPEWMREIREFGD